MNGVVHLIKYTFWIIKEIFKAGWDAIVAAFKPNPGMKPIIIYYPMRLRTDWEIFWFTTSITATPGTLSIGLRHPSTPGGPIILMVQAVFGDDPVGIVEGLADMEEHVRPALKSTPLDASAVEWEPYIDYGPEQESTVPPAERLD